MFLQWLDLVSAPVPLNNLCPRPEYLAGVADGVLLHGESGVAGQRSDLRFLWPGLRCDRRNRRLVCGNRYVPYLEMPVVVVCCCFFPWERERGRFLLLTGSVVATPRNRRQPGARLLGTGGHYARGVVRLHCACICRRPHPSRHRGEEADTRPDLGDGGGGGAVDGVPRFACTGANATCTHSAALVRFWVDRLPRRRRRTSRSRAGRTPSQPFG